MKRSPVAEPFTADRLITDLEHITTSINAPYSRTVVQEVLKTFGDNLSNGAIAMRTSDRPGDPVNFWAGEYNRADTITQAVDGGIISPSHPTILLLRSWFALSDETEPSTDFDTAQGLAKTWVYLRLLPMEEVLNAEHVPESFRQHLDAFKLLGALRVYHVAVSYRSTSVNIYPHIPLEFTPELGTQIIKTLLPDCPPPTSDEIEKIMKCAEPKMPIIFGVTMSYPSATIERVCFYTLHLKKEQILSVGVGERLETFLKETPCYDTEKFLDMGWSFGRKGDRYQKMTIGYCGGFSEILQKLEQA